MITVELNNNQRLDVLSASVKEAQNEVGTFDVDVLYTQLSVLPASLFLTSITLWYNDSILVSGIVDSYDLKRDFGGNTVVTLHCLNEVGRLATQRAKSTAHYQNQTIIFIITDILAETADWQIGDVSTLTSLSLSTTVDLRDKEFLWAQIVAAVESCPDTFVRYGGIDGGTGKYTLDVGVFGERASFGLVQDDNLVSIDYKDSFTRPYYEIEGYGGKSGGERITLDEALAYDPTLATNPDFPIVSSGGRYVVRNNAITTGLTATKSYSLNKTKNDGSPDATDKGEAAYALWQSIVTDMKKSSDSGEYTATARFATPLSNIISQRVFVRSSVLERAWDIQTGNEIWLDTFNVADYLRITGYSLTLSDNALDYDFELRVGNYAVKTDASSQIYDSLNTNSNADSGAGLLAINLVQDSITHGPGTASDATLNALAAKSFVFALPSGPLTNIAYAISINPVNYIYAVQAPAPSAPATPLTIYVQPAGPSAWGAGSQATIVVTWITS